MSKIICEVCGTSYPETSAQCPICGSVHAGESFPVNPETSTPAGEYSHVKGGRFSKSNVRKRNKGVQLATSSAPKKKEHSTDDLEEQEKQPERKQERKPGSSDKGLVITIIVLILAIIAVLGYIVVRFLLPALSEAPVAEDDNVENPPIVDVNIPCTDIQLDANQIQFSEVGQTHTIKVSVLPADTTDSVSYASADETVAVVDKDGVVTALSRGETVITVTCGSVRMDCAVICDIIPAEALAFRLNRQQITFDTAGAGWLLYSGEIPVEEILWSSDDETVATVVDGKVTAVGEGYACVYGEYLGNKQVCEIICAFEDGGHDGNGGVTEDGSQNSDSGSSEDSGEYRLDNLYSNFDTEVSLSVGEWFPLRLVDENGNQVDATWSVENGNVCKVNGGDVTALASGQTYVIATYNGQQYKCLVRVR